MTEARTEVDESDVVYSPDMGKFEDLAAVIDKRFNDLHAKVDGLSGAGLAPPVPPAKENWFKRNAYWLSPALSLVLGSGIVLKISRGAAENWITQEIDAKLKNPLEDIRQLRVDVPVIRTNVENLTKLVSPLVEEKLRGAMNLPQVKFEAQLPEVKEALEIASAVNLEPSPPVVAGLRTRFEKTPETADQYWAASAAFINYRWNPSSSNKPICFDHPPSKGTNVGARSWPKGSLVTASPPVWYSDCILQLDSRGAEKVFASVFPGTVMICSNCTIAYAGGQIVLPSSLRPGDGFYFIDCKFDVKAPAGPPAPAARSLITTLVAASGSDAIRFLPMKPV